MPILPAIGSTMTAAIWSGNPSHSRSTDGRSLKVASRVSAAAARVTPGLVGTPRVVRPEPAWTRN
jgi:hypothetical protein